MKTLKETKFGIASIGLGLLIFTFAFFISVNFLFVTEEILTEGNETTAIQTIVTIRVLQHQFTSKHKGVYARNFDELIKSENLDEKFKGQRPIVNGYIYTMKVEPPSDAKPAFYSINVDPKISKDLNITGTLHFYFDSTLGTIKGTDENRQANAEDSPI